MQLFHPFVDDVIDMVSLFVYTQQLCGQLLEWPFDWLLESVLKLWVRIQP